VSNRPHSGTSTTHSVSHPASSRQRILDFLASRGGSLESEAGRGITSELAKAVGYEDLSTLNGMLARLEREGVLVREVRGRRTYRIALTTDAKRLSGPGRPTSDADGRLAEVSHIDDELCHPRAQLSFYLLLLSTSARVTATT